MSTIVREINGIRGFCMYKGGVPYTYIYTRDAIEMLGLSFIQNNKLKLRINTFGEHFVNIINGILPSGITQNDCGVNLTPNYSISQDNITCATDDSGKYTGATRCTGIINREHGYISNISEFDTILPEYTLDRVIFSIANRLHNKTSEEFRLEG